MTTLRILMFIGASGMMFVGVGIWSVSSNQIEALEGVVLLCSGAIIWSIGIATSAILSLTNSQQMATEKTPQKIN